MPTIDWNRIWEGELEKFKKTSDKGHYFGDQWGHPNEMKWVKKVVNTYVLPFINKNHTTVEIGSGGGRWTQFLLDFKKLYCVDLNKKLLDYLLERFGPRPNISFIHTTGTDLSEIPKNSVDFVFSFDVFVHLDIDLIREYLKNIKEIVKDQSNIVIHYSESKKLPAKELIKNKIFSENTAEAMRKLVLDEGYIIISEDLDTVGHSNIIHFKPKS